MNFGSGPVDTPGWIHVDRDRYPHLDHHGDLLNTLPWPDDSFEIIVANHSLQQIDYRRLPGALDELRRLLEPGGVLRILVPDLDKAVQAYLEGDNRYFLIADVTEPTTGGKLALYLTWWSTARTLFTEQMLLGLLARNGFSQVRRMRYGKSHIEGGAELDSRKMESLIIEAIK